MGTLEPKMGTRGQDISSTLFGKTRRAVLALTYGHPDESFHLRRIARFAGCGMGAVQREVEQLAEVGILLRTHSGRQVYYQANRESPIFGELRDFVTKTAGVADVLRDALIACGDHIVVAFVFGSVAKGTQGRDSDVDLLVIGDVPFGDVVEALASAQDRIGREVNPTVYPRREFQQKVQAGHHFLTRVLAESKVFLVGSQHELERLAAERVADGAHDEPA